MFATLSWRAPTWCAYELQNAGINIMSLETILLWAAIGLIAGWLASAVVGGGYGVVGDIVVGVVGAFIGGFIFRVFHIASPLAGIAGTIFVAFIGAIVLLLVLRLIHRAAGSH